MNKILQATHEGYLKINLEDIKFSILENRNIIIQLDSLCKLFNKSKKELHSKMYSILKTGSPTEIESASVQLFKNTNNVINEGFPLKIINTLHNKNKFKIQEYSLIKSQLHYLIYKNLNFPFLPEHKVLIELLPDHFTSEKKIWIYKIPINFYIEIFRLNGWEFSATEIQKRPTVISKWLETILFKNLPKNINRTTTNKTIPTHKLILIQKTFEIETGNKKLNYYLIKVLTILKTCKNMKQAWIRLKKINYPNFNNIEAPYLFNENGHTIEPIENSFLSNFNKKLKTALDFNKN